MMTQEAKWKALASRLKKDQGIIVIFWFEETMRLAQEAFSPETALAERFLLARQVHPSQAQLKKIIFAEHYPLAQKEKELMERLHFQEAEIWSAMDDPLFREFGSDKIIQLMKQLGMKEDQVIEHNMISKAIHNAQEKIEAKVSLDQLAVSQDEWLQKNWRTS